MECGVCGMGWEGRRTTWSGAERGAYRVVWGRTSVLMLTCSAMQHAKRSTNYSHAWRFHRAEARRHQWRYKRTESWWVRS